MIGGKKSPNVLMLVVDELLQFRPYETPELQQWRANNLLFMNEIASKGTVFLNHYANTNACVPSRTTLQTGTYPSVHGNTTTDALAISASDVEMSWLAPYKVPTIANYLKEAGYRCHYRGKWHLSDASIKGEGGYIMSTYDSKGNRLMDREDFYLNENVLEAYGYDGWIGPEPHGKMALNSGGAVPDGTIGRDEKFVEQALELLDTIGYYNKDPWFFSLNLVDPHDIAIYGQVAAGSSANFYFEIDPTLPDQMFTEDYQSSYADPLTTKPPVQTTYKNKFQTIFQPLYPVDQYARYYYSAIKKVDAQLMRIWQKLISLPCYDNTIVIFTSDHGELLGSHGLYQKWFQAYEEAIHIPLIISSPLFSNAHRNVSQMTSHIDILPTIIDMAGCNIDILRTGLSKDFKLPVKVPGSSIYDLVKGLAAPERPIYFYTEDNPTKGPNQVNVLGVSYDAIGGANCVETVINSINGKTWKYSRYYPKILEGPVPPDQPKNFELYNITDDYLELNNLATDANSASIVSQMSDLLYDSCIKYRFIHNK